MLEENKIDTPGFLYHYTSINNLALILQNQTIRFSCLENLNDLTEGTTSDYGKMGQYIFVSCWTDVSEESIPLWNLYTPNMTGVRIKLPSNPFKRYGDIKYFSEGNGIIRSANHTNSIVPKGEIFGKDYSVQSGAFQLHKVLYTKDMDLLTPKFKRSVKEGDIYNLQKLGKNKSTSWSFESEWRYLFWILPSIASDIIDDQYFDKMINEFKKVSKGKQLPINQYFLKIREEAFEQAEILIGPKHSPSDITVTQALINSYNPKAVLKLSSLTGKIK